MNVCFQMLQVMLTRHHKDIHWFQLWHLALKSVMPINHLWITHVMYTFNPTTVPIFKDQYNFILDDAFQHRTTVTLPFWGFQLPFAAGACLCPAFFWGGFKFAKDNFPIFPQDCWEIPRIHNSQELKIIDKYWPCMKLLPICQPSNVNTGEMLIHLFPGVSVAWLQSLNDSHRMYTTALAASIQGHSRLCKIYHGLLIP